MMAYRMNGMLGLAGHGQLFQTLLAYLEKIYQVELITDESSTEQILSCRLLISCEDSWLPQTLQHLNQQCIQLGIAFLPVCTYFQVGIVGPFVFPHTAGCTTCAEQRRIDAAWNDEKTVLLQASKAANGLMVGQPWLPSWNREILAQIVIEEITAYLSTPSQVRTQQAQFCLALDTQQSSLHHFLPSSDCPDCGSKQPDTPEQATIVLQSRTKPSSFSYHVLNLVANEEALLDTYVDAYLGIIPVITSRNPALQPHTITLLHTPHGEQQTSMSSMGIATRWNESRVIALLEALERLAGQFPRKKKTGIHTSYCQLTVPALDPTTLGLHDPSDYNRPGFNFVPYDHNLVMDWVWGYSFKDARPLLVPETCAYYGRARGQTERNNFVYEISNGCALGGNLEEAILHGILEVAERDAFLLTWYARLALPRLDLTSITDQATRLLVKHMEQVSGYTLYAFNATLDHAMPCLWIMAVDEQQLDRPRVFCSAGSHPHPERALTKALQELGAALFPQVDDQTFEEGREHRVQMFNDPFEVRSMADHSRLYWLPEAFEWLSFLYHSPRLQSFQEAFVEFYKRPQQHADLRDDLSDLIDHYLHNDLDVIVVDQTSPEQDLHDLRCVKVLIPGTLSMTFGHANRRTIGCRRLYQLPRTLGYQTFPLTEADINPHPHPFP